VGEALIVGSIPTISRHQKDFKGEALPIIDYKCPKCEVVMPIFRKVDEAEIEHNCSNCEIKMERVWAAPAVHFKGTGWGKD
jgi:putative FmdB family regulatory protein